MSGQGEPRSFKDLKHLFPDRAEWVRLSGELGNFLLDQSQVSLVACPRNQTFQRIQPLKSLPNGRPFAFRARVNTVSTERWRPVSMIGAESRRTLRLIETRPRA